MRTVSNWEKTMKEWDDSVPDGIKYLSAEKQVLMRRVRELESENARLKDAQRWRVVANGELPEDGEVVWLWDGKYIGMGYYLVFAGQFMDRDTPLRPIRPSHWMRFPESPEVQK